MDQTLQANIDQLVKPLLARIQQLETTNQQLIAQVCQLQRLINHQPSYQRLTLSASQHIRQSRISSKEDSKKPNWNSNTKYQSPKQQTAAEVSPMKIKTKPPIPKIVKSPTKPERMENTSNGSDKKFYESFKDIADNNQYKHTIQNYWYGCRPQQIRRQAKNEENLHSSRHYSTHTELNNKFQKLVKRNTELVQEMIQQAQKTKSQAQNYVQNTPTPKSYHKRSTTTSPSSLSLISQNQTKKGVQGAKVNRDSVMAKMQIK